MCGKLLIGNAIFHTNLEQNLFAASLSFIKVKLYPKKSEMAWHKT